MGGHAQSPFLQAQLSVGRSCHFFLFGLQVLLTVLFNLNARSSMISSVSSPRRIYFDYEHGKASRTNESFN